MAYPFAQMPTLGEFVEYAVSQGCMMHEFPGRMIGPRGSVTPRCLRGLKNVISILPNIDDDDRLTPLLLRNLCAQLGLDINHFSMH